MTRDERTKAKINHFSTANADIHEALTDLSDEHANALDHLEEDELTEDLTLTFFGIPDAAELPNFIGPYKLDDAKEYSTTTKAVYKKDHHRLSGDDVEELIAHTKDDVRDIIRGERDLYSSETEAINDVEYHGDGHGFNLHMTPGSTFTVRDEDLPAEYRLDKIENTGTTIVLAIRRRDELQDLNDEDNEAGE